jgi:hypothetical protein
VFRSYLRRYLSPLQAFRSNLRRCLVFNQQRTEVKNLKDYLCPFPAAGVGLP